MVMVMVIVMVMTMASGVVWCGMLWNSRSWVREMGTDVTHHVELSHLTPTTTHSTLRFFSKPSRLTGKSPRSKVSPRALGSKVQGLS